MCRIIRTLLDLSIPEDSLGDDIPVGGMTFDGTDQHKWVLVPADAQAPPSETDSEDQTKTTECTKVQGKLDAVLGVDATTSDEPKRHRRDKLDRASRCSSPFHC